MPSFDARTAKCFVYAYKEGLLSAVGHDVKLRVDAFEVTTDGEDVRASFDAGSLRVVAAMRDGAEDPRALSDRDKATIEGYVKDDILHARRYPKITFRSTSVSAEDDEWTVEGDLELHGRRRSVTARLTVRGDELVTKVRLHQPDFGIAPFKAMLGALRIQPQLDVELVVPRAALA